MRKFLSVVLTAAMLLCVLFAVPVQAQPYEAYPFVFEDFEDGTIGRAYTSGAKSITYAEGGAGGSKGSILVEVTATVNGDISIPCVTPPKIGEKLKFSAWIKLENTDLAKDTMSFIFYGTVNVHKTDESVDGPETKQVTGWKQISVSNTGIKKGEWVYVSYEADWDASLGCFPPIGYDGVTASSQVKYSTDVAAMNRFSIRIGSVGGINDLPEGSEEKSVRYYADDLKYEIAPVAVEEDFEIGKNIVENGEFDENKTGWSTNGKMTIVNDPADPAPDGSAGYLKMEPASADKPYWNQIGQKMTWQANHLYKVSYYMKFDGPLKEGTTDTAAVYSGDSNSTTYNLIEVKTGGGWLYQGANGTNRVSDTNSYNANYPGYVKKQAVSVGNGWSKIEYYYVHEFKTFTDKPIGTNLRLFAGDNQNLMSSGVFGLDSFKIIDMGPISNGDFEIGQASVIKFPKSVTQNVLGWTESSATSAQAAEARPGSEGTSSMKVTLTANGGYVYQGLSMTPSRSYKISFWAKGNDLDSEVPFALVMDRKVPASGGESESYTVPDYEYITGKNEICTDYTDDVKASQSWKLSNEWTYYECYYDNEFPLLDGLTKAVDYTFPRLPFMYFNVNGNASGTSYSLDDVQIECIGAVGAVTPVITNAAVTGKLIPGEKVGVSYNYSHPTDGTDDSIVRMLCETDNGQYASLGSFKASEQITVPETAIGKNIVFEILPVDGNANCGITVRAEASDPGSWAKIYVDAETLAVRAYASENKTAKVIYAAYNGKELISVGFADVNLTANTRGDVTIPAEFTSNGADTVKVMLWEGIENVIPLCTNETLSLN